MSKALVVLRLLAVLTLLLGAWGTFLGALGFYFSDSPINAWGRLVGGIRVLYFTGETTLGIRTQIFECVQAIALGIVFLFTGVYVLDRTQEIMMICIDWFNRYTGRVRRWTRRT